MTRYLILAGALLAATGCAANPEPEAAPAAPAPAAGAISLKPAPAPALDLRASSLWVADERLLPQRPILALIASGGSVNAPAGLSATCSADTGAITARLGRQPTDRKGQSATYQLRVAGKTRSLEGRFEAAARASDAEFVFTLSAAELREMAGAETVTFVTDKGDPTWVFVRDPATPVSAPHIASLKDLPKEAPAFIGFCNPK
jgi:hypothetical protein